MKFVALQDGEPLEVEVQRHGSGYRVRIEERWIDVDMVGAGPYVHSLRLDDGTQLGLLHHREGNKHEVSFDGRTVQLEIIDPLALKRRRSDDDMGAGGVVKAMMPGRVVRVLVSKGETVRRGTSILILEAMKMENDIQASVDGVVDEIFVEPGQTVEAGADLVHIG